MKFLISLIVIISLDAKEVPLWIKDPSLNGQYIGAIGCTKELKNKELEIKIAFLRAKGSIAHEIVTEVEDSGHMESIIKNEDFDEEFSFESKQSSVSSFEVVEMSRYRDENQNLCIWVIKK